MGQPLVATEQQKVLNKATFHEWQTNMSIPSQVLDLVPHDIVVEGILDSDVPQMQGFENKSVFLKISYHNFRILSFCLQTNVLNFARV